MQWAVTAAIGAALGGGKSAFSSLYYQNLFQNDDEHALRDFPYDMPFLSPQELYKMVDTAKKFNYEIWPIDRIDAAKGKHILAKRAAHSPFLWQRYSEQPDMSLETLRLWFQVEQVEKVLTPPDWFQQQHPQETDMIAAWDRHLGTRKAELEGRHRALIERLLSKA